jgi:DNA-directed RNA polymerase specialized sigma24 family protein
MTAALQQVRTASHNRDPDRRAANPELVQAIHNARDANHTLQEIADVLGISRQAVHAMLSRNPVSSRPR